MRILVTGARNWKDVAVIAKALKDTAADDLLAAERVEEWLVSGSPATQPPDLSHITVVHGGARGADTIAGALAEILGMSVEVHPAQWEKFGRGAGPIRNQSMADLGADICLAFLVPGSKGTADCIARAEKAGIKTVIHPLGEAPTTTIE